MAASGSQTIQLYYSTTSGAAPSAGNLTSGEFAVNITDGKLYYKDNAGAVQVLATKGTGAIGGSNTQVQYNNNGSLAGSGNLLFDGTTLTTNALSLTNALTVGNGGTGATTLTGYVKGNGTSAMTASSTIPNTDISGLGTMSTQNANSVAITGGTVNGTSIGATTASTGAFTTLTTSSTVTLNGGTANGVAYLNGSKVLTTGSALTFDGTNLGVGNTSPSSYNGAADNLVIGSSGSNGMTIVSGTANAGYIMFADGTTGQQAYEGQITYDHSVNQMWFNVNAAEQMRLTSTGLGIGTSSPDQKLAVNGRISISGSGYTVNSTNGLIGAYNGTMYLQMPSGNNLQIWKSTTDAVATFDQSGNLGLGVTPSAWSVFKAMEFGAGSFASISNAEIDIVQNAAYLAGTNWTYKATAAATMYRQGSGAHSWWNAPSGTAGNAISFTQAMTLDASGNLGVGTTSPSARLHLYAAANEMLRLESSSTSYDAALRIFQNGTQITNLQGGVGVVGGGTFLTTVTSAPLVFGTVNTERARIDSSGNLLVGTTSVGAGIGSTFRGTFVSSGDGVVVKTGTAAGNVPLGCFNPATTGDNNFVYFYTETSPTVRGSIDYNRAGGLTRYNTTSDYRAKDIIGPVQNVGATIDALKVYEGVMKGATQSRPMLIAHEAQQFAPYAVSGVKDEVNEDGSPKFQQIDVSSLVPLLLAEIQSLRKRLAALEAA